jgi:hypothetical protein
MQPDNDDKATPEKQPRRRLGWLAWLQIAFFATAICSLYTCSGGADLNDTTAAILAVVGVVGVIGFVVIAIVKLKKRAG